MVPLKTKNDVILMRQGGRILNEMLNVLGQEVRPGIKTFYFEELARGLIKKNRVEPAFLHYRIEGKFFPAVICVSVNDEIVHVPPSERVLKEGDIVKLDFGIGYKGWYIDQAATFPVGSISRKAEELIEIAKEALGVAVHSVGPGVRLGGLGYAIQSFVEKGNFSVVRNLTGHGIGRKVHEEPSVFNYGEPDKGIELQPGMVIAIEPMVVCGKDPRLVKTKDGFGYASATGELTAHFEHTVAITERGAEILTIP